MLITTRERHGDPVVRVQRRGRDGPMSPTCGRPCSRRQRVSRPAVVCDLRALRGRAELPRRSCSPWPTSSRSGRGVRSRCWRRTRACAGRSASVGVTRRVPVAATVAEAREALRSVRPPARAMLRLAPGRAGPGRGTGVPRGRRPWPRRGRRRRRRRAGVVDLDAAALVLTELVTNAVLHAGTDMEVLVSVRPRRLRLAVADQGSDAPSVTRATADDEHGRGLALVDALARCAGVSPRAGPPARSCGRYWGPTRS